MDCCCLCVFWWKKEPGGQIRSRPDQTMPSIHLKLTLEGGIESLSSLHFPLLSRKCHKKPFSCVQSLLSACIFQMTCKCYTTNCCKGSKSPGGEGGQSPEVYAQFLLISLIFNISSNFAQNVVHSKDPGGWSFCSLWARCWTKINAKYTSGLLEATSAFPTSRANKHTPPDRHTVLQASYGKS